MWDEAGARGDLWCPPTLAPLWRPLSPLHLPGVTPVSWPQAPCFLLLPVLPLRMGLASRNWALLLRAGVPISEPSPSLSPPRTGLTMGLVISPAHRPLLLCSAGSPSTSWGAKEEVFLSPQNPIALFPKTRGLQERPVEPVPFGKWTRKTGRDPPGSREKYPGNE